MAVSLTGKALTIESVVAVARQNEKVELHPGAVERIKMVICRIAEETLSDAVFTHRLFGARPCRDGRPDAGPHRGPAQAVTSLLAEQVRQAQEAGEIRPELDPVHVGGILRAILFNQMMMWHHGHKPAPLPELLSGAVDLFMEGVAGPAWRSQR